MNVASGTKIVVLDDDPTGCQTVHDIVLSFFWDVETLKRLIEENDCFYILTNSRALTGERAYHLFAEISGNLLKTGYPAHKLRIVCRSDSTLRGHFIEETRAVFERFKFFDGLIVAPFFKEGGRVTKDDIHYVVQEEGMVPVNKTEFAKDKVFGYKNAWLPAWIEEKSDGYFMKEDVASISLYEIRSHDRKAVLNKLMGATEGAPVILNALEDSDVEYFCTILQEAEEMGKSFLYRTGASFVKVRAGISDKTLYNPQKCISSGLIIAGSFVEKTTQQIRFLEKETGIDSMELSIDRIISRGSDAYLIEVLEKTDHLLRNNKNVLIYTERREAENANSNDRMLTGEKVSLFLAGIVSGMEEGPGFIISKGGITSHQLALHGLKIGQARVLGQVLPGVPVIRTDTNAAVPEIDYVIFPGNVGSDSSLHEVFIKYSGS